MPKLQIDASKLYSLKEAAQITQYSVSTLRRRIKANRIKTISSANERIRIWGSELINFIGVK